eukprot:c13766_g1_i1.p1 GENE.c13766_g1_i1~~c13766_g1_i1.p1  ORF type:complete len:160 (+),score=49.79 c13766_g1_i1:71-481(+)
MRSAFSCFDQDGDGKISTAELQKVMNSLSANPTQEEIDDLIHEIDADGDGEIDFSEFLNMMAKKLGDVDAEVELREAFSLFDTDHNGLISKEEFKRAMIKLGENISDEQVNTMMKTADLNGDGFIDFEEFRQMMNT